MMEAWWPERVKVLLAADNPADARFLQETSRMEGARPFDLTSVPLLRGALARLGQGDIRALVLDLELTDSKGVDTLLQVYRHSPEVPVVALTGVKDDTTVVAAIRPGAPVMLDGTSCMLTTLRDVTEWKELQRKLVESERLASTGQFAGFIVHPINTPLTNIAFLTHAVETRVTDPAVREKLEKIDVQRKAAANILMDLMSFARHRDLHPGEVDRRTTVVMACAQVEPFRMPAVALLQDLPREPGPLPA